MYEVAKYIKEFKDNQRPVLFVEDDVVDHILLKRAFKELNIINKLEVAFDGEAALAYLRYRGNARPYIIILDLNMPRLNGIEFLGIVKKDKEFKMIPVVILTTSQEEQDKVESFNLGVAGYMIKPVEYRQFVEMIAAINNYWALSEVPN